jgi:TATA-box binding protein (TBP) (component of TFIID and TFIIIB)
MVSSNAIAVYNPAHCVGLILSLQKEDIVMIIYAQIKIALFRGVKQQSLSTYNCIVTCIPTFLTNLFFPC